MRNFEKQLHSRSSHTRSSTVADTPNRGHYSQHRILFLRTRPAVACCHAPHLPCTSNHSVICDHLMNECMWCLTIARRCVSLPCKRATAQHKSATPECKRTYSCGLSNAITRSHISAPCFRQSLSTLPSAATWMQSSISKIAFSLRSDLVEPSPISEVARRSREGRGSAAPMVTPFYHHSLALSFFLFSSVSIRRIQTSRDHRILQASNGIVEDISRSRSTPADVGARGTG